MARVKYGPLIAELSGSIGTATFQRGVYGNILRTKPNPHSHTTPLQLLRRMQMMAVHAAWHALSDAQRKQWNQFVAYCSATIGRDKLIAQTGHSYFFQYNLLRQLAGFIILDQPLYISLPSGFRVINLTWADEGNSIHLYPGGTDVGVAQYYVCHLSPHRDPARAFRKAGLRYMAVEITEDGIVPIHEVYFNVFGRYLQQNEYVHYSIRYFGLTGSMVSGIFTGIKQVL